VENSEGPQGNDAKRTFTLGSVALPGVGNPTGYVLDRLKKQLRRR
jgi:hypothetical protein